MINSGRYAQRGVSSTKNDVHNIVDNLNQGPFPGAFCKITQDFLTNNPNLCNVIHSDGSGTKSLLAYLYYKETGDPTAFKNIAIDSIVMNLDDLICVGATNNILISSTINRNPRNIPGEVLQAIIQGTEEFLLHLRNLGVNIHSGGGETADVPDLTQTVTIDSCATAVIPKNQIINNANITPNLAIVGLASSGQATYENSINSGIAANGLTSARHDLLSPYYKEKYPETFDSHIPQHLAYSGKFLLSDNLPNFPLTIGQALLSPTRTYAPLIKHLIKNLGHNIKGIIHCSGGGQTKCLRFGNNIKYIKNNLFNTPPIFQTIQKTSQTPFKEMFQVFNMGHRMELLIHPRFVNEIIKIAHQYNIPAQQIGYTDNSENGNSAVISYNSIDYCYKLG